MRYPIPSADALRAIGAVEATDNGILPVKISPRGRVLHVVVQRGFIQRAREYIRVLERYHDRVVVDGTIGQRDFSRALVSLYRLDGTSNG